MARGEIYAQVSCDYYDNDKMVLAGEKAELLYIRALCLSNRLLLDGKINGGHLVTLRFPDAEKRAAALVREGLWEKTPTGWLIVGWQERNRTRMEIMAIREAERERKRAERNAARAARANGQKPPKDESSDECPPGQPPESDRTDSDVAKLSEKRTVPIDQRSTLNAQRSSTNAHRPASDEVNIGGRSTVSPPAGSAPGRLRPEEPQGLNGSIAAVLRGVS